MRSMRLLLAISGSLLLTLALGACGGSNPAAPAPAPTPVPTPTPLPYIGNWSGTTSQGRPFSFVVGAGGITSLSLAYQVAGGGCTVTGTATITMTNPAPVTGNAFTVNSTGSTDYQVTGIFASASAASGNLTATTRSGACSGLSGTFTWSANKA